MDCASCSRVTAVEFWLRDQVAPAHDALRAEPSSAFSVADVRATLTANLQKRLRQAMTDTVVTSAELRLQLAEPYCYIAGVASPQVAAHHTSPGPPRTPPDNLNTLLQKARMSTRTSPS